MAKRKKNGHNAGRKTNGELRDRKRTEFEQEGAKMVPRTWFVTAIIGFALLAVVGFGLSRSSGGAGGAAGGAGAGGASAPPAAERVKVTEAQDYSTANVEMTDVKAKVAAGEVSVPLAELKKNKLLYFKYSGAGKEVPLMAMITPSGKLFTASAMCEPCRSDRFHTEPDGTLTCNACGTKWDLETLQGISGGCPNFPPQEMKGQVKGDKIVLQETDVQGWQPRTGA